MTKLDKARSFLSRTPRIRKYIKKVSGPIIRSLDNRATKSYNDWLAMHLPSSDELASQSRLAKRLSYRPLISIIVPVYNPPEEFFKAMLDSVLAQSYDNWELVLVDDASPDDSARKLIEGLAGSEGRVRYRFLDSNKHISGASNVALDMSKGDFVALLDNDDILQPNALYEVAAALNNDRALNFIYSDEDKLNADTNMHTSPYFKPSWNQDFLYSVNYITHLSVLRKSVVQDVGGFDGEYNGAQDWELFLRVTRQIDPATIHHIPKILYSWRVHEASTAGGIDAKPYVVEAQRKAIEAELSVKRYPPHELLQDRLFPAQWLVNFSLRDFPKVAIIVPDEDTAKAVDRSIAYDAYEVVVRKSGDTYAELTSGLDSDYVIMINERLDKYNHGLVELFLSDAQRNDVGFVVARHLNQDDVMINIKKLINPGAIDFVSSMSTRDVTKHFYSTTRYDIPFVDKMSATCIETRKLREVLKRKGGSVEEVSRKAAKLGYRNLYNPYVSLDVI